MATGLGIAVFWRKALTMSIGRIKRHRHCRGIAYDVLDAEGKPVITGLNLYGIYAKANAETDYSMASKAGAFGAVTAPP